MATKSFYENLVIETEEQAEILLRLFEEAENRPPRKRPSPTTDELVEEGNRLVRDGHYDHLFRRGSE